MTQEEKESEFSLLSHSVSLGEPVLPNDFRRMGITSYREAREFLAEFIEHEKKAEGIRWTFEEKPYKCRVIDPVTREVRDGEVTAFWGSVDVGWSRRQHDA